jgi:BASS family bile acid:Na+ symporter
MIEKLQSLDAITLNFKPEGLMAINITLAFIMFGVALGIRVKNFKNLLVNPRPVIVGFVSQFFLLPAVTFIIVFLLRNWITPAIGLGMLLVASCPGGNISNFISSLAKGNVELSVTLTAIATICAIFLTPLNFAFWGKLYAAASPLVRPIEINPLEMFYTVLILLGIPIVLGMLFAHYFQKITQKIIKPVQRLSIIIFMGIVILAFSNNYEYFIKYIGLIFLIVLLHNGIALATGFGAASLMRLRQNDRRTITIETGIQNSGLGLVLLFTPSIFPPDLQMGGMAFIAAWWGIWHILAGLGIASFWSKKPLLQQDIIKIK